MVRVLQQRYGLIREYQTQDSSRRTEDSPEPEQVGFSGGSAKAQDVAGAAR